MTADARADLLRDVAIRMAILRQRTPWVLRELVHKDRTKQERAQGALIDAIASCVNNYNVRPDSDRKPAALHSCP